MMKVFFLRFGSIMLILLLQFSFLDIVFPQLQAPLLLLVSIVAWTLVRGFPESLLMTVPLGLLFDSVSFGMVGSFSLYAVILSYATSFLSRRLLIEHRGLSLTLYALFASAGALGYRLFTFFFSQGGAQGFADGLFRMLAALPSESSLSSFVLGIPLFAGAYFVLKRFEERLDLMSQKQFLNVR